MQFPNSIQSALLFDGLVGDLEAVAKTFMSIEAAKTGATYNVAEANPGLFYRLYGGDELMVTLEYMNQPAKVEIFQPSLASPVTRLLCPDISERLTKHRSHILINVSHGVLGDSTEVVDIMTKMGMPLEGASLSQFQRRLEVCALLSRIAQDDVPATAVHWTQSDQLLSGDVFELFAKAESLSHLHIHPYLYGGGEKPDGKCLAGIRTFGARHFIGREILIEPSALPWAANFETILAFLRVATMENGYIIPDGDSFGPDDGSRSYRVIHRPTDDGDAPIYELEPLMYREYGFQSETYVPKDRVFDDRTPPEDLMPTSQSARASLIEEWRSKRGLAEGIGGQFEVRAKHPSPSGTPQPPPSFGRRPIFGRKASNG